MKAPQHFMLRKYPARWKVVVFTTLLVASLFLPMLPSSRSTEAVSDCSPDGIKYSGSSWLGGDGVNVCNEDTPNLNTWNYVNNINNVSTQTGYKWECVELVNRLYITKGWITSRWSGSGNTMVNNVPSGLIKENNGSISYVNPGDAITFTNGGSGHAAVIDNLSVSTANIINQNSSVHSTATINSGSLGQGNATFSASWFGYSVQAIIHAPSTPPTPTRVSNATGYDGDTYSDLALIQKATDGGMGVSGAFGNYGTPFQTVIGLRALPNTAGWDWTKVKIASGYFNSDLHKDIALVHQLWDDGADIHILYGGSPPFNYSTTYAKTLSAADGWRWSLLKVDAGDYNGDSYSDLALLQKNPDGGMGVSIAYGNYGTPFQTVQGVRTLSGSAGWVWDKVKLASGYFNSDTSEDLALLHQLPDDSADVHILYGGYPPFNYSTTFAKSLSAADGWQWSLLKVESGNYNGDSYSDLSLVQKNPDGGMGVSIAYGNYGTPFQTVQGARTLLASSGWDWTKVLLSSGYYNSDDSEDIVLVHGLWDNGADLHVLYGGSSPFSYSTTFAKSLSAADGWQWSLLKVE